MTLFVKRYADPARRQRAHDNHRWLTSLSSAVVIPAIVDAAEDRLVFEAIDGRPATAADLAQLAQAIGRIHASATSHLATARIDQPHQLDAMVIPDFITPRLDKLLRAATRLGLPPDMAEYALTTAAPSPAGLYKDSNLRNFLITGGEVAVVDFDDLTLAPHCYDLAKLIVSIVMTHGRLPAAAAQDALDAYHDPIGPPLCTSDGLRVWAELNWLLTADHLGRNGYQHPWPELRPWPDPLDRRS
ncbi:phosphotransferase [Catellatospora coxensis]|uniref:Aminoglycoside phosphotransferase domain-containing protein n=1 Tax=Catellatospora coxensis TaxID=310354 RepID=A0A8J3KPJ3_9ACTN|nr:phosphotransferase [Catellatospora coxensis]GIG03667.1 hypothetical protein Cco03nite_03670 [Catellatospora coxensis]